MLYLIIALVIFCGNIGNVVPLSASVSLANPPGPFEEGTTFEINIHANAETPNCVLSSNGNPDYSFTGTVNFGVPQSTVGTATVSVLTDSLTEGKETVAITLNCGLNAPLTINVPFIDASGAGGDPHFKLLVLDKKGKKPKNVCFDVSSSSKRKINIFGDVKENVTIYGILKDDYYMHQIKFHLNRQVWKVTPDGLFVNGNLINWIDQSITFNTNNQDLKVEFKKDMLYLTMQRKDDQLKESVYIIKKSKTNLNGIYLDIFISNLHKYKSVDGILGQAVKQSFEFFDSIQTSKQSSLKINDKLFSSEIIWRDHSECCLLNVNDILYPKTLEQYLF